MAHQSIIVYRCKHCGVEVSTNFSQYLRHENQCAKKVKGEYTNSQNTSGKHPGNPRTNETLEEIL